MIKSKKCRKNTKTGKLNNCESILSNTPPWPGNNELASFTGPNTIKSINKKGEEKSVTAAKFILATGGRPVYPEIEGAKEFGITSDDIFSMPTDPGKTLLVGASYISLENAGFLSGMGKNVTIMVRILGAILIVSFSSPDCKSL